MPDSAWFIYVLRCADGTLYTGITTDLSRRLAQHNGERAGGAKYTQARRPVQLVYQEPFETRSLASKRESQIKRLPRKEKLALIQSKASSVS